MKMTTASALTTLVLSGMFALSAPAAEYHVATTGDNSNPGTARQPLHTIQAAADRAQPGDTVTVHPGVYREWVNPPRGGTSDANRITYQAAPGETVVITGSDRVKGWENIGGDTWKVVIPSSYFGKFNPYEEKVHGDWFSNNGRIHRRGNVYLNGEWLAEAPNLEAVMKPAGANPMWYSTVDGNTTLYAQFPGVNPNEGDVEISVRPTVFTPEKTNIDYITVRGFKLRNAATNWAAPTSGQVGLVTAYWNKGWIIENNEISYSRCSGIALGKYSDPHDNTRGTKEGYDGTIADALATGGWSKEKIGGHLVRNNHIHHCGQTGIVGSLGCAFSRVENNEIHDCNRQGIWGGAEMAGIKFHGAIDTVITGNHIYNCGNFGGIWLDWMAQGAQVTSNLLHDNQGQDLFTEVNHGPYLVANNIMLSPVSLLTNSQGGAFAHNLMAGRIKAPYDSRRTPYHKAHSTELAGRHDCPVGDVRWYNNLLAGNCNLAAWNGATLPVAAAGNVFTRGATASKFDTESLLKPDFDAGVNLVRKEDGWYLEFNAETQWAAEQKRTLVTTELLGQAKIPDLPFENPDGTALKIDGDYFGKKRNGANPFPGPFEISSGVRQSLRVWPRIPGSSDQPGASR